MPGTYPVPFPGPTRTNGWGSTFLGRPTEIWRPRLRAPGSSYQSAAGRLALGVDWAQGREFVIESAENPGRGPWSPIATNILRETPWTFSIPVETAGPARFFRLKLP